MRRSGKVTQMKQAPREVRDIAHAARTIFTAYVADDQVPVKYILWGYCFHGSYLSVLPERKHSAHG